MRDFHCSSDGVFFVITALFEMSEVHNLLNARLSRPWRSKGRRWLEVRRRRLPIACRPCPPLTLESLQGPLCPIPLYGKPKRRLLPSTLKVCHCAAHISTAAAHIAHIHPIMGQSEFEWTTSHARCKLCPVNTGTKLLKLRRALRKRQQHPVQVAVLVQGRIRHLQSLLPIVRLLRDRMVRSSCLKTRENRH